MSNRRLTSFLAVVATVAALQSCNKSNEKTYTLVMQTSSPSITMPATTYTTSLINYGPATAFYNVDSFISSQTKSSITRNNITSAHLLSATLTFLDANPDNNLNNFETIALSITTDKSTQPYTVAINAVPDLVTAVAKFPTDSTELRNYFGTTFNYTVSGKLRKPLTETRHVRVDYVFQIDVKG